MSSGGAGRGAGVLLVPVLALVGLLGLALGSSSTARADSCGPTGPALVVDLASVPQGPVAGYGREQLVNAAHIMLAAAQLGLTARDQQIGVMTAMVESSLRVLDRGDTVGPDSRGLFQQRDNGAWGSYADRMDPYTSATNFFRVEMTVAGRETMAPTLVAHQVQRNADPNAYAAAWEPAGQVVAALAGVKASGAAPSSSGRYTLGPVQPATAAVVEQIGPMFGITTVGGYRDAGSEQYDPNGHPAGLAADFMIAGLPDGRAVGDRLAEYVTSHAGTLGVKYVIWRQRIWSPDRADEGWRPMEDRGSPTANHLDHVHVSLTGTGAGSGAGCGGATVAGDVTLTGWARPAAGPVTSGFGPRAAGAIVTAWHGGLDLAGGGCDGPIWAANAGTVITAGAARSYGNLIEIDHGSGVHTRYAHMFTEGVLVHVGDRVTAGQQIGRVGTAGNSTGCHLHFEVLVDGARTDPRAFLDRVLGTAIAGPAWPSRAGDSGGITALGWGWAA